MEHGVQGATGWALAVTGSVFVSALSLTLSLSIRASHFWPNDGQWEMVEQRTYESVNRERTARGLPALQWDEPLTRAARQHSQDMADRRFMSHTNPDGYSSVDRARLAGVRRARRIAENLGLHRAQGDPVAAIVQRWMNSPPHRQNILNRRFKYTGVGVAQAGDGTLYFTQLFADR